jgi:hypothetical protein
VGFATGGSPDTPTQPADSANLSRTIVVVHDPVHYEQWHVARLLPNGANSTMTLRFVRGMAAGMALDDQGYYEMFGDPPRAFRDVASCGELPIEVCADRFEVKGLVARFVAGDLSYREP